MFVCVYTCVYMCIHKCVCVCVCVRACVRARACVCEVKTNIIDPNQTWMSSTIEAFAKAYLHFGQDYLFLYNSKDTLLALVSFTSTLEHINCINVAPTE